MYEAKQKSKLSYAIAVPSQPKLLRGIGTQTCLEASGSDDQLLQETLKAKILCEEIIKKLLRNEEKGIQLPVSQVVNTVFAGACVGKDPACVTREIS